MRLNKNLKTETAMREQVVGRKSSKQPNHQECSSGGGGGGGGGRWLLTLALSGDKFVSHFRHCAKSY